MASTPTDTNQKTPMLGDSCDFHFTRNVGVPIMATLNLLGFTLGLLVWLFSTPTVLNAPDASRAIPLCQEHKKHVSPSLVETSPPPSTSCGESSHTSNLHSKRNKISKNMKNT